MVNLIIGIKGTGKTKRIVSLANDALEQTNGSIVFIEKGTKLIHEVKHEARLVDTDEYAITSACALYGFVSGILASNNDVTDIFIDSALKICSNDMEGFTVLIKKLDELFKERNQKIVITSSIAEADLPAELAGYVI